MLTKISSKDMGIEFIVFSRNKINILVLKGNEIQDHDYIFTFKPTLHNRLLKIITMI